MNKIIASFGYRAVMSASVMALTIASASSVAHAQVITSEIGGYVTNDNASPIAGAQVTITNTTTGFVRTVTTDSSGAFQLRNLNTAGLYDVSVSADNFQGERVEGLALSVGSRSSLNFVLGGGDIDDVIVVVAQRQVLGEVAPGPSSIFGLDTLENAPAINRDIKDIIRLDPRVYVDETNSNAVQCAGANPRFNSLTVDGIRLNDNFGLNSNGFPTERLPFSFDAIQQVAVELAPYDVEYGGFTACNINAVTKSGANEIFGSAFIDYTSEDFKGDKADGQTLDNSGFEEIRYGINVGLPLVKDKLFLFAAYEKLEGADLFGANTPEGTGITQAQFDEIIGIAEGQYGYVSGGLPSTVDNEDEKLLVKLDWNINDRHRLAATYNYNDGFSISGSDTGTNRLSDGNHFYERGAELNAISGALYSDWNDKLSTELRVSHLDLQNRQLPLGGLEFGEVQIRNQGPRRTTVYLGADDSRHANQLNYELTSYKAKADYAAGQHNLTIGAELEDFEVFNLFIQEAEGEWVFDSIEDFRNGDFSDFRYENAAGSNNIDDGAAKFGYQIWTAYVQDEWFVTDQLTLTAGLRLDAYTSDDKPTFNQSFFNDFGIRNDANLDGKSLLQPRFAFNYNHTDTMSFRGGLGLYSGGNPNVWLSNNYSNNGVTLFESRTRGGNLGDFTYGGGSGTPFFDVPDSAVAAVAAANGRGPVNALDPEFDIPSELKLSLGTTFELNTGFLGNGYNVNLDALGSFTQSAALYTNLDLQQTGQTFDGRPIFNNNPFFNNFVLTNAKDKASSFTLSGSIAQEYDNGVDWTLAYAYTDAEDVNPMTSSVAFSNYNNISRSNPQDPGVATSNYEIKHRFTFRAGYEVELVQDYKTRLSMFASLNEGRPFSFTYNDASAFGESFRTDNQLFYVPTGVNDPNVIFDGIDTGAFFNYLNETGLDEYAGQIAPRNAFNDDWFAKIDLRISQQLPGLRDGDRASVFAVMKNVGNFIDSDWGVLKQNGFPGSAPLTNVAINDAGQYVYSNFNSNAGEGSVNVGVSTWELRFGAKYDF
ncbi:Oar protein [Litorimonas cladophorae]|uniref:Oar protein n=1 Tax=Litorimonas cladophorae TaxID=1220491 RepID=A0A918KU73_9PROT|nr:TonB-dependent receptor [Litorimonas cladophorae]GGX73583.1 Oar protein [Litorimonas cladophorae]